MQIAAADIAIVNKIDLIDTEQQHLVQEWVKNLAPHARILKVTHGCAPIELILGHGGTTAIKTISDGNSDSHNHSEHHNNPPFDTFTYESDKPLSLHNLHAVLSSLPQTIFRVKGILNLQEKPEHRCVLQATGRRAAIEVGQPWGEEQPVIRIQNARIQNSE